MRVKRPGCNVDHPPPGSAEVKYEWSYTSTPPIRLHSVQRQFYLLICDAQNSLIFCTITLKTLGVAVWNGFVWIRTMTSGGFL
jgi:hypothetical protein